MLQVNFIKENFSKVVEGLKKRNKVVELSDESVSLLSDKIDNLEAKVAVAIKVKQEE